MDDAAAIVLLALLALSTRGRAAPGKPRRPSPPAKQGTQREATRTVQTPDAARSQIVAAFDQLVGREPTATELGMLLAHSAGETGRWQKMHGWNYGYTTTRSRDWFVLPGNPLHFEWYPDAPTGALGWLRFLQDGYPAAWEALGTGDPVRYVDGLLHGRAGSYFGNGPVEEYQRLVGRLYLEFLPVAGGARAPNRRARGQTEWLLPLRGNGGP